MQPTIRSNFDSATPRTAWWIHNKSGGRDIYHTTGNEFVRRVQTALQTWMANVATANRYAYYSTLTGGVLTNPPTTDGSWGPITTRSLWLWARARAWPAAMLDEIKRAEDERSVNSNALHAAASLLTDPAIQWSVATDKVVLPRIDGMPIPPPFGQAPPRAAGAAATEFYSDPENAPDPPPRTAGTPAPTPTPTPGTGTGSTPHTSSGGSSGSGGGTSPSPSPSPGTSPLTKADGSTTQTGLARRVLGVPLWAYGATALALGGFYMLRRKGYLGGAKGAARHAPKRRRHR